MLAKHGIAAPTSHPLKLAVTRHKARLSAELTKLRLSRGFASIDQLREQIEDGSNSCEYTQHQASEKEGNHAESRSSCWPHPRWVRVNILRTTLEEQLETTFAGYQQLESVEQLLAKCSISAKGKCLVVDKHVSNLLALPPGADITTSPSYRDGHVILQDKASCFPACLLNPRLEDGNILDACAAPGNKTTHIAAILHAHGASSKGRVIWACESDKPRAAVMQRMVDRAAANEFIKLQAGQDFLGLRPEEPPWNGIGALLLDPSCSGSGILGRDDKVNVILPRKETSHSHQIRGTKRKRRTGDQPGADVTGEVPPPDTNQASQLNKRLKALSDFQLRLLLHAFQFPRAKKITYSTCSIYVQENELVVLKALKSSIAKEKGWRILKREEQVEGLKAWDMRGSAWGLQDLEQDYGSEQLGEILDGCIRCERATSEGTQGFFVVGFVRDNVSITSDVPGTLSTLDTLRACGSRNGIALVEDEAGPEQEWEGFSTSDGSDG